MNNTKTYFSRQRLQEINRKVNELVLSKRSISFDEVPEELRDSLEHFLIGCTLSMKDGKPSIFYSDFSAFVDYLWRK